MTYDVVISGCGPNGMMLALELRLAGVRPVILERRLERDGPVRANGVIGRVVQFLDYRGLFARLSDTAPRPAPMPLYMFGGFPLHLSTLPAGTNPMYGLQLPQPELERRLEAHVREVGIEIRRGHELTGFSQRADGVVVDVTGPAGAYQLTGQWLVGADGSASPVRKLAGIGFPDLGDQELVSRGADVVLDPELTASVALGANDGVVPLNGGLDIPGYGWLPFGFTRTVVGSFAYTTLEPGIFTVATNEWGRSDVDTTTPMSVPEMRASIQRVLGVDIPMTAPTTPGPHRLHRLVGNSRQAEAYRAGRVLLVGDSAHVHAPIGGPGLNLGLQDAVNLAWKLAGTIHGWAPDGLLDTYYAERHPVGQRVLMQTQAQMALMGPGPEIVSLGEIFAELLREDVNKRYIARLMAGADVRYDLPYGCEHPLAGDFAPDLPLSTDAGEGRFAELMRTGRPVLLDLTGSAAIAEAATGWKDRVDLVTARAAEPGAPAAMLVRPDGYVAWATDADSADGLPEALRTWFGTA
jgi:2-polyprenyl-6-methoxyphenol hydroxylase-like FAD-dependent oxidoreductase